MIDRTGRSSRSLGSPPIEQHDQEHAADDRHGEQRLEQGVRDELNDDDVPVGGGDERAALERGLQRSHGSEALDCTSENSSTATMRSWRFMQLALTFVQPLPPFVRRCVGGAVWAALARRWSAPSAWSASAPGWGRTPRGRARRGSRPTSAAIRGAVRPARDAPSNRVAADPDLLAVVQTRDDAGTRALFVGVAEAAAASRPAAIALTVYGPEARPIAWAGRPESVPDSPDHRSRRAVSRAGRRWACGWCA